MLYSPHLNISERTPKIIKIEIALCAIALLALTGCPDAGDTAPPAQTATLIDEDGDLLIDINTLDELSAMRHNLDGTSYRATAGGTEFLCGADAATACIGYELLGNLDFATGTSYASGTVNADWRPAAGGGSTVVAPDSATNPGWEPIGTTSSPFSAHFNGNGFTISNLYARRGARAGLFGTNSGTIEGIGTVDANIYGGAGVDFVGGLVGQNTSTGTITASYSIGGSVDGGDGSSEDIGGLIGRNDGTVTASYATGNVDGGVRDSDSVGGLIGRNIGTITASYATGDVDGGVGALDRAGGLIGFNDSGTITASYGFGTVMGGTVFMPRSADASQPGTVPNACALTQANSSMTTDNRWGATQWDFGTTNQRPIVLHDGNPVRGQEDRGCN